MATFVLFSNRLEYSWQRSYVLEMLVLYRKSLLTPALYTWRKTQNIIWNIKQSFIIVLILLYLKIITLCSKNLVKSIRTVIINELENRTTLKQTNKLSYRKINLMRFWEMTSPVAQTVKNLPTMWETWVRSLGWKNPLEKGMATHCSILVWRIPWTEKPGKLQFMELQRAKHDWATFTSLLTESQIRVTMAAF